MRHHGTLKFTLSHMNYVLMEKWEAFKLSSVKITHKYFNKTHIYPLSPTNTGTNNQVYLTGTHQKNRDKVDDIGGISKATITPIIRHR